MVGAAGVEPATFCSQSRRAEPLRYAPLEIHKIIRPPLLCKKQTDFSRIFYSNVSLRTDSSRDFSI